MYRLFTICCLCLLAGCGGDTGPTLISGHTMGTTYSVKIADQVDEASLRTAIETELVAVNAAMSTYLNDSEISRFNQAPVGEWFTVSAPMIRMVSLAQQIHAASNGKFDATIGPLVNLWGFGPVPTDELEAPATADIEQARSVVDMSLVSVAGTALRRDADIYLDLSAIAKGYGVDRLAALVEEAGATNYLVEIGGELRARGNNERGSPWTIAIERPDLGGRVPFTTVKLIDDAIATSGDYRNYYEIDGERYSHLIDPTTGRPIRHNLASVTVLADSTAVADGYATAIYIMGPEAGLALAEAKELAVFVIIKGSDGFESRHSSAFEAYLK